MIKIKGVLNRAGITLYAFLALCCEALPLGVISRIKVVENGEPTTILHSFFSLEICKSGSLGPMITGVLTVIILTLGLGYTLTNDKGFLDVSGLLSLTAIFSSLWPLAMGFTNFTLINCCITLFLIIESMTTYKILNCRIR